MATHTLIVGSAQLSTEHLDTQNPVVLSAYDDLHLGTQLDVVFYLYSPYNSGHCPIQVRLRSYA